MPLAMKNELRSLIELLFGLRTIRRDWKKKTPFEKWAYMRDIGKMSFGIAGVPILHEKQTLTWYSYFPYFYVGLYTLLVIYTAGFYIARGEFWKCLPSTCLLIGPFFGVSSMKFHIDFT